MKMLMRSFALWLGVLASNAQADQVITVDGKDYFLSFLTANCQSITNDPAAQIACFGAISELLEEQSGGVQESKISVTEALDALRAVAQYQDDESGLSIAGSDCNIHLVYFNNYFHISRRNISTIDLFSAQFDASNLQYDQIVQVQDAQSPVSKGFMAPGVTAVMHGGVALESAQHNFSPRSPRTTLDVYANEVVGELQGIQSQEFDFVLVHPQKSQASADIWSAFATFVDACKG